MFRHTDHLQSDVAAEKPDPVALGGKAGALPPDPELYNIYDGSAGSPKSPATGTEKGLMRKVKDALDPDKP